ncbi:MAG: NADH-quinone oxidoreductase subunit L, partial [Komagataeibacter saccharivorans]
MAALLPLVVVWPLAATVIVFLSAGRIKGRSAGILATGAVGLSAMTGGVLAAGFMSGAVTYPLHVILWEWMRVPGFSATIAFALDPVSLVMIAVVTIVGFLIHLYAIGYMAADPGSARFFGCMTLFVAAMLVLVLASDLLCL